MKVLYIIDQSVEEGLTSGIIQKIQGKIRYWDECGVTVELLSLYNFKLYSSELNLIDKSNSFKLKKHTKINTLIRLIFSTYKLKKHISHFDYDLFYMRTRLYIPFYKNIFNKRKLILELNSNDLAEFKLMPWPVYIYHRITRQFLYSSATAFVSVSDELTTLYDKFNLRTCTIANGIDLEAYKYYSCPVNKRPKIVFMGSPGYCWHGIDKIQYLASELVDFDFYIYGVEGKDSENIYYKGYLNGDLLRSELALYDIGISTLSLHEKNMEEASPLKSRQYMAHGIPFIYAYDDTDLVGNEKFTLKIPNSKNNVKEALVEIKSFIVSSLRNERRREEARSFACEKIESLKKEAIRINFFKSIL